MINKDFAETGSIYEKYEAETGSSKTQKFIDKGYSTNDVGFAWTNSAILETCVALDRLQKKARGEELEEPDITVNFNVKTQGVAKPQRDTDISR